MKWAAASIQQPARGCHCSHTALLGCTLAFLCAETVQRVLSQEFRRSCLLIHNGVDCERFCPGPREAAALAAPSKVLLPADCQVSERPCDGWLAD